MPVRKWGAVAAAVARLKSINGAPYRTNLEGRVFTRAILPTDPEQRIDRPYACLELEQEAGSIEYMEDGRGFERKWRCRGYAFFDDNVASDPLDSAGAEAAADFEDDLLDAFLRDQYLGGETRNCEINGIETLPGSAGDPTTWVLFYVEFTQGGAAVDLEV